MKQEEYINVTDRFELLNVTPTQDFFVIWGIEEEDGTVSLRTEPVDAIGVASVEEVTYSNGREIQRTRQPNRVVGLTLMSDLGFEVCESNWNFAGMVRDLRHVLAAADANLRDELKSRLRPEFRFSE